MIYSLFDCCLIVSPFFYDKGQRKPYFRGFVEKYLLHRCFIDGVKI